MRRRTFLLAAGLLAYFAGASANAYLRCQSELCGSCGDAGYRIVNIVQHPRLALNHPLLAIEYLVAPGNCAD
jgi:hypothetical protein